MADPIIFPGTVEWSGENPGISLKEREDGPFVALASFFRVVLSPHGRGHALVLLRALEAEHPPPEQAPLCLTDNEPLARFLVAGFVSHFGAFRGRPGLNALQYRRLDRVETAGDPGTAYSETVAAGALSVRLSWTGLGPPFCFVLPPDRSATGRHHMPSLFVPSRDAAIEVNGRRLPGQPVPREMAGRAMSTAMLAFSETWIRA
ncbi:MAG: hypothetical protein M0002_05600 [Rhodospirillales bacterium]|nr:hypothetical protein [Rhodospirillales bacterium]